MVRISEDDSEPLDTIKMKVLRHNASKYDYHLSQVDLENTKVTLSDFDETKTGMTKTTAFVSILFKEDSIIESDTSGYAFSTPIIISVDESTSPKLLLSTTETNIDINGEFNPTDYIAVLKGSSATLPALKIDNPVDTNTAGTYEVTYTAINSNGYSSTETLTVNVQQQIILNGATASVSDVVFADEEMILEMFNAINEARAEYGLDPYVLADSVGQTAAAIRAMEAYTYTQHYRPDGRWYASVFEDLGVTGISPLEILVRYGTNVQRNLAWWLSDYGHRIIVLDETHSTIAIGFYGDLWAAEVY